MSIHSGACKLKIKVWSFMAGDASYNSTPIHVCFNQTLGAGNLYYNTMPIAKNVNVSKHFFPFILLTFIELPCPSFLSPFVRTVDTIGPRFYSSLNNSVRLRVAIFKILF